MTILYCDKAETILRKKPRGSAGKTNSLLLGTWLKQTETSPNGQWLYVTPRKNRGKPGWVRKSHVRATPSLKIFYVDVGQGDGALIESAEGILVIDGGPNTNFKRFLRHRYRPILKEKDTVHIDAVVVTHPDTDHFKGLTALLNDERFTFGTIYHNGIIRYDDELHEGFDLGALSPDRTVLRETFSSLADAGRLIDGDQLMLSFHNFWVAAWNAQAEGRLQKARILTSRARFLPGFRDPGGLQVEVLGPVPTAATGSVRYSTFAKPGGQSSAPSSSHTRNGHSIVLRLNYSEHSFLFGGDLNTPAERHLLAHYGGQNPFRVDVAKACHHGSSDFTTDFLKQVRPRASVFSSGDHKSYDHPMPDALGAMARHSRGDIPLLFSTEIGRARSKQKNRVHYGLVNARSNGELLVMAQMKEQHNKADVWDSFKVPFRGRFPGA